LRSSAAPPRLLITAFGWFDGGPNCSERLLARLTADRPAVEALWGGPVATALLAVDCVLAEAQLARALADARPTHLLLTGQAAGRPHVSLERVARNRLDLRVPDDRGRLGPLGPVRDGGPDRYAATWPDLEGAAAAIRDAGVPAQVSDDAGAHLCNQTLYLALEAARRAEQPFVATFLHLPLLTEQIAAAIPQAAGAPGCVGMDLDDMARAVRAVLVHTRAATDRGS
jgi:pyroglutamyl-peptidase